MRPSGEKLSDVFAQGACDAGADVVDIGMVSTDALYFSVGKYELDGGVMITASHNPSQYNGMKFTRGLRRNRSRSTRVWRRSAISCSPAISSPKAAIRGKVSNRDVLEDFARHCVSVLDSAKIQPFKIAVVAGNGMAGEGHSPRVQVASL